MKVDKNSKKKSADPKAKPKVQKTSSNDSKKSPKDTALYDDEYILKIQKNKKKVNNFIEVHLPLIHNRASALSKKYYSLQLSDITSNVMHSFYTAVITFKKQSGHFYPFAETIIQRRIIDLYRTQLTNKNIINLKAQSYDQLHSDDENNEYNLIDSISYEVSEAEYKNKKKNAELIAEITALEADLKSHNITFEQLVTSSPKSIFAKTKIHKVIKSIQKNKPLQEKILKEKDFPVKEIATLTSQKTNLITKHSKYIVAILLIESTNKFPGLKEHLSSN